MATTEQINHAREILQQKLNQEGQCPSCGWHALLSEHNVNDFEIIYALDHNNGILELFCENKDDEYSSHHRLLKINVKD